MAATRIRGYRRTICKPRPLSDLGTEENELSVWEVADDRSNLSEVLAGYTAGLKGLTNLDYMLVDRQIVEHLGILLVPTEGNTPSVAVNVCHRSLRQLTGAKLLALASAMATVGEMDRVEKDDVGGLICEAVRTGKINRQNLKEKLRQEIDALLPAEQ